MPNLRCLCYYCDGLCLVGTLIDAMDTLAFMGLTDEFWEAVEQVNKTLNFEAIPNARISVRPFCMLSALAA